MRPPAREKLGYYPTPQNVVELLSSWFVPSDEKGRLLDPCAGEGTAAQALGERLQCSTWGAELSPKRVKVASEKLAIVQDAPWEQCSLTDESISFLFLNPPYDDYGAAHGGRLEMGFLKSTVSKVMKGGALALLIPDYVYQRKEVYGFLHAHYDIQLVKRFPKEAYAVFKQLVIVGTRKEKPVVTIDVPLFGANYDPGELQLATPSEKIPLLPAPKKGAGGRSIFFRRKAYAPQDLVDAARYAGVQSTVAFHDLLDPERVLREATLQPVMPLKKGHLAMLMASGMMGTLRLTDEAGVPFLVKGRVVKEQLETTEQSGDKVIVKYTDHFKTTVATVSASEIAVIEDVPALQSFMEAHGDRIADHVLHTYRPLYNLDPTEQENAVLNTLGRTRKPLPGQAQAGLLPTQRHAAAALARAIQVHRVGNLQGEMGSGKTTIGAGVVTLLDAFPAIVLCPPHLVPKWCREIEEVIPGARASELKRIGKNASDKIDVNDVRDFLDRFEKEKVRTGATPRWVAVVSSTSAKLGAGWEPKVILRNVWNADSETLQEVCCCPDCGQPVVRTVNQLEIPVLAEELESYFGKRRRFCTAQVPGWETDSEGRRIYNEEGAPIWGTHSCNAALFQSASPRRWSIADYILKHARHRFKMLVSDEAHEYKGKSSDRGVAFHQLIEATQYTLTLTGTFFGGKSTSIFWLLHRLNYSVRQDFAFNEASRWAQVYGVLQQTVQYKESADGRYSGNRRYRNSVKELPGVSPAILQRLLDTTIFIGLKDLGLNLPEYREEVVNLTMTPPQASQYADMAALLKGYARQSSRFLSIWLQWCLSRPNSAFRAEEVLAIDTDEKGKVLRKTSLMELPAIEAGTELPKEAWLADYCRSEKRQGRKVLVYLRQTGTRDIQPHVAETLKAQGLRVAVLTGSVSPRKRERWIEDRVFTTDVLLCNPMLVATGLDLVAFSTVIFFEMQYSLYTTWQALRRVWRLGQTKPVKAIFTVYDGAMEADALALMGQKMKAAQLLYGDEVGGAIVPESGDDFLTQLARTVLEGKLLPDLQTLFADSSSTSTSPLGSPTKPSVTLVTWQEWADAHGVTLTEVRSTRRASRQTQTEPPLLRLL